MIADTSFLTLCEAGEVTDDTPVRVEKNGFAYAVFLLGGRYYVTNDLCTHGPGSLAEGWIEGDEVECPFHQGKFNIITGAPTAPPCTEPLRTWTAHVRDGLVMIEPAEVRLPCGRPA